MACDMGHRPRSANRARRREEIIDDLMLELGGPAYLLLSEEKTREALSHDVEILTRSVPLWKKISSRKARAATAEWADRFDAWAAAGIALLHDIPGCLALSLFGPLFGPLKSRSGKSVEEIVEALESDRRSFLERLSRMRAGARTESRSHRGGEPDVEKDQCASFAYNLMKALTRRRITGTTGGPFETFAALLYEACGLCRYDECTLAPDANLKRSCDRIRHFHHPFRKVRPQRSGNPGRDQVP
jgi:hypothetical protein